MSGAIGDTFQPRLLFQWTCAQKWSTVVSICCVVTTHEAVHCKHAHWWGTLSYWPIFHTLPVSVINSSATAWCIISQIFHSRLIAAMFCRGAGSRGICPQLRIMRQCVLYEKPVKMLSSVWCTLTYHTLWGYLQCGQSTSSIIVGCSYSYVQSVHCTVVQWMGVVSHPRGARSSLLF